MDGLDALRAERDALATGGGVAPGSPTVEALERDLEIARAESTAEITALRSRIAELQADTDRVADLEAHNLDVREVTRILRSSNFDQSLGTIIEPHARYSLRTVGAFASLNEIRSLPLRADGLKLRDVADVVYLLSLPESAWINGTLVRVDGGERISGASR